MNRPLLFRGLVILAVLAWSVWSVYPPKEKINLGLDLQGGIHLVLGVKTQDAVRAETDKDLELLQREAADASVRPVRISDTSFELSGLASGVDSKVLKAANEYLVSGWEWRENAGKYVLVVEGSIPTKDRRST